MAILDKIKGAAAPIDINAALADLEAATKLEGELVAHQTKLRSKLEQTEAARDRYALDDDAQYDKLDADAKRLEAELKKNLAAVREAGWRRFEAEKKLRSQRHDADVQIAKQLAKDTVAELDDLSKGLSIAIKAWEKLHGLRSKKLLWRPELAINAGGLLLRPDEIRDAIELEIVRLSTPQLPLDPNAVPSFPGARTFGVTGTSKNIKPLSSVGKEAGDYLVRRIEKLIRVAAATAPAPAPAPAQDVEQAPVAAAPAPTGSVSAEQVMAGLGRRRMA